MCFDRQHYDFTIQAAEQKPTIAMVTSEWLSTKKLAEMTQEQSGVSIPTSLAAFKSFSALQEIPHLIIHLFLRAFNMDLMLSNYEEYKASLP